MARCRRAGAPMAALTLAAMALCACIVVGAPRPAAAGGLAPGGVASSTAMAPDALRAFVESLRMIGALPYGVQRDVVKGMVQPMVPAGGCNPLGGRSACRPLRTTPRFDAQCPTQAGVSASIDCIFASAAERDIDGNLDERIERQMTDSGMPECPTCVEAQRALYCALTAPACGAFDRAVYFKDPRTRRDRGLLPAVQAAVAATPEDYDFSKAAAGGDFFLGALQRVVPEGLAGLALGLPCREMCARAVNACDCGGSTGGASGGDDGPGFGEMVMRARADRLDDSGMGLAQEMQIFESLYDVPVCDLFYPRDTPGFIGQCNTPAEQPQSCPYCMGLAESNRPTAAAELIAEQMFAMLSALVTDDGLGDALNATNIGRATAGATQQLDADGHHAMDYDVEQALAPLAREEETEAQSPAPQPKPSPEPSPGSSSPKPEPTLAPSQQKHDGSENVTMGALFAIVLALSGGGVFFLWRRRHRQRGYRMVAMDALIEEESELVDAYVAPPLADL